MHLAIKATIDHHGFAMYSGHYAASVYCCEKKIMAMKPKLTVCNINHTRSSSTTCVVIYKLLGLWSEFTNRTLGMGNI